VIRWVVVESDPPLQIHDDSARAFVDPSQLAHEVLVGVGSLRASVESETPSVSIALANEQAESMPIMRNPPLGYPAVLYGRRGNATIELFRGIVTSVTCGADASLEISA
jgi:hypothetical protein